MRESGLTGFCKLFQCSPEITFRLAQECLGTLPEELVEVVDRVVSVSPLRLLPPQLGLEQEEEDKDMSCVYCVLINADFHFHVCLCLAGPCIYNAFSIKNKC